MESGDLNRAIGELTADAAEARRQRDAMWGKLNEISKGVAELRGCMSVMSAQQVSLDAKIKSEIMPTIEDMKALKQRGIGVMVASGLLGGGAWAGITKVFDKFTG